MCSGADSGYHGCMTYVLHYAPDNASMIVRMALDHAGVAYRTALVDRARRQQESAAYRKLNPHGLIPALETPQGAIFETGAILLWLVDAHDGLGPKAEDPGRGAFLAWLFHLSNTTHATLRQMFHAEDYIAPRSAPALRRGIARRLKKEFGQLNDLLATDPAWLGAETPTVLDFYLCALLRWSALYPDAGQAGWFNLDHYPALARMCAQVETLECTAQLARAEGMGPAPFTRPEPPNPPEGSPT